MTLYCTTNDADCKQPESCADRGCFTDRARSLRVNEGANTTKRRTGPSRMAEPSYEKGIATEKRPGGFEMPYLVPDSGSPMGIKEANEKRKQIKDMRDKLRHTPTSS